MTQSTIKMKKEGEKKMCVSCCLPFSDSPEDTTASSDLLSELKRFSGLFSFNQPKTYGAAKNKGQPTTTASLVCSNCISAFHSALTQQSELNEMEVEVRKLQGQLINLLRGLQKKMKEFSKEVNKVEDITEKSNQWTDQMKAFYNNKYLQGNCGANVPPISVTDAMHFRVRVMKVAEELTSFKNEVGGTRKRIKTLTNVKEKQKKPSPPSPARVESEEVASPLIKEEEESDEDAYFPEDDNDFNDMCEDDLNPGTVPVPESATRPRRIPLRRRGCNAQSSSGEDDESDSDSDSDKEYLPAGAKATKKVSPSSLLTTLNLEGMTPLKRKLITFVINRCERRQLQADQLEPKTHKNKRFHQFDAIDPLKTHFLTYNPESDTLEISGFQFHFLDEETPLQCSESDCGRKFQENKCLYDMQLRLFGHVLGHHLKVLNCPHCQSTFLSYSRFKAHVLGHLSVYDCDVCGKPFKGRNSLTRHKWLHLNEEEKAEAVKKGEVNPQEKHRLKMQKLEKKFQCEKCGAGFKFAGSLKKHEELHESRKYMCANCGKSFKTQNYLNYHQKIVCFPGKDETTKQLVCRWQCDQCLRKFPVRSHLLKHKHLVHSEHPHPRPFKCETCGKGFRTKQFLKLHQVTHSDARPFSCQKGCGAAFKQKRNCMRHEKTCGHKAAVNIDIIK